MSRLDSKASSYRADERDLDQAGKGRRFAICAARFNDDVVGRLIAGARDALRGCGAADEDVELFRCPGAMELAGLARRVAATGRFDGIICLGAVIRGGTPHFDLVAGEAARGIGALAAEGRLAVAFGVLACDTLAQALERAGDSKETNRGHDAAMVAVEMAELYARLGATDGARGATGATDLARARAIPRRK
jgi:6,7-dimethyl-8-ribityllumazine synthase